jgi:filamentous hemagglutinin
MDVQATRLDNRAGKISSLDTLTVSSANTDNRGGTIRADQAAKLLIERAWTTATRAASKARPR